MISVVIPVYNRAHLIKRAIRSVLSQQCDEPIEVLVVDDHSDDGTAEVVSSIQDERVQWISLPQRSGACAARNAGIDRARGDWIAFQDSDDEWMPGKLQIQLNALGRTGAGLVFTSFWRVYEDGGELLFPHDDTPDGEIHYKQLLYENLASTQTIMARADVMRSLRFDERYPRLQDWEMVLRAAQKYRVVSIRKPCVRVYMQPDSISRHPEYLLQAQRMLFQAHRNAIVCNSVLCRRWMIAMTTAARECGDCAAGDLVRLLSCRHSIPLNVELLARAAVEKLRAAVRA